MNTQDMLNDYEQFATFFQSLSHTEDYPQPVDIDSILESIETGGQD